jgi:predicted RNA-binding protein YlxR (DUF448 family)
MSAGRGPERTCVGCRQVRPQGRLLRLARTAGGRIAPDPRRRAVGRGAYLCRSESCLAAALRRNRWVQLFRASATLGPDEVERLRALVAEAARDDGDGRQDGQGHAPGERVRTTGFDGGTAGLGEGGTRYGG